MVIALTIIATVAIPQADAVMCIDYETYGGSIELCDLRELVNDNTEIGNDNTLRLDRDLQLLIDRIISLERRVSELDGLLSASSPMPVQTIPQNYNSNDAIIAQQVENAGIEKLVEDKIAQQVAEKVMPEKAKCWFFC